MLGKFEKYSLIYSPRTTKSNYIENEENLFNDLVIGFDPYSIQILKRHFKEQLGELTKETFISILKRHLLTWHPNIQNREKILIKLLSRLFDEIDLNSNGNMEWDEFTNYIIHSSIKEKCGNSLYKLKFYNLSKQTINHNIYSNKFNVYSIKAGINEIVSYCFYVEKLNIIGLIHDESHKILFFDGNSCEKKNYEIDLVDILDDIDKIEFNNIQKKVDKNNSKLYNKENYKNFKNKNIKKLLRLPTPNSLKLEIEKINNKNINFNIKNNKNTKISILCCEYLNCYDILLISSSNNKISAWKFYNDDFYNANSIDNFLIEKEEFKIPIFSTEFPQLNMCFDHKSKLLYSGQYDGKIFEWELTNPKPINILNINSLNNLNNSLNNFNNENKFKSLSSDSLLDLNEINNDSIELINLKKNKNNIKNFQYNRKTVSCLLLIEKIRLLASAYYNGNIILWDTILKIPKKIYNDQKTGIYQMCYDNTKNLLFSCGFEHSIFIYDPYNEEHAIYKLNGHNWSINSISLNPYENELISMDILGNIKIWDINNYYNYQTINLNDSLLYELNHLKKSGGEINKKKISSNLYLLSLPKLKKILVYGDKFLLYEKEKSKNPNACDDNFVLGCVYNPRTNDLITISSKSLKIWSIYIGKVRKLHDNLMDVNDITAFCFDNEMKRVYLGDNTGKIKCFNLSNGTYLKDFSAHNKEIHKLIHSSKYNMLISLCNEQIVKFHDDQELLETTLIKDLYVNNDKNEKNNENVIVKDAFLNEKYNLLIMGLSNGNVSFYDITHFRYENEINKKENHKKIINSISSICNIDDLDVVFVSYENGKKNFTLTPRNKYYKFIFTEKFGDFEDDYKNNNNNNNNKINDVILCTFYNKNNHYLYCGDDTGHLNCFDLKDLIQTFKNQNFSKENFLNEIKKIQIKTIYKISVHKESINYINYPQEISPEIIITTSTDHYVKLINVKTGEFIDSLKQISFKIPPIPIAIKYIKNNPFLKNNNLSQNNIEIIYRSDIENQTIKIPQNEINDSTRKGVYIYSNLIMQYNAKIKLLSLTNGIHLKKNRSTNWNFDVNIDELDKLKEFNMKEIIKEVDKKQNEIEKTEKNFTEISIFNPNYKPLFIKNLDENSKIEFNSLVNNKIRNIKFAITKSQITINEFKMIEQIEKKTNKNYHKNIKSYSNKKKINLKKINKNNIKNLPLITMSLNETKFKQFKNDFDRRIDELKLPFKLLKNRKNKKKIPKLSLDEY